jgi:hypothetical protein
MMMDEANVRMARSVLAKAAQIEGQNKTGA